MKVNDTSKTDLLKSGLSDEMITAMGVESLNSMQLSLILDRKDLDIDEEGYKIPYFSMEGKPVSSFNVRLLKGVKKEDTEKRVKYLKPSGTANLVYFPPNFKHLYEANNYVIITEGEKKAAKACQEGFPCVAISGVWNWFDNEYRNFEKAQDVRISYKTKPLMDLLTIAKNKKIILMFDSDAEHNDQVRAALVTLSDALLYYTNYWVRRTWVPAVNNGEKMGIDDLLLLPTGRTILDTKIQNELSKNTDEMLPLVRFPYGLASSGRPVYYTIPNTPFSSNLNVHRILKDVLAEKDGMELVQTKEIASSRIWMNRVVNCIDDDNTIYEMAYVPLAENDIKYVSGGSELINLGNRASADFYANLGVPILSKEKPLIEEFWHHCQTYGVRANIVKKVQGTRRRGWIQHDNQNMFLIPSKVYSEQGSFASSARDIPLLPIDGPGDATLREVMKPHGSYDIWKELMLRYVLPNTTPSLYTSGGLASILRHWCPDSENFVFHLYSDSSAGKTTAMYSAAALWGKPERLKDQWRATDNGLEGRCVSRNHMLLCLDEAATASEEVLKNSVYMIGNGGEKLRAQRDGSDRRMRNFQLVVLSTGERALLRGERHAGQEVRVLEVPTHVTGTFWDASIKNAEEAETFSRAISQNYGFGADLAIKFVLDTEKRTPGFWARMHVEMTNNLRNTLGKKTPPHIIRRVKHFGLLLTAYYVLLKGSLQLPDSDVQQYMLNMHNDISKHMLRMATDQFSHGERHGMMEHLLSQITKHQVNHFNTNDALAKQELWGQVEYNGTSISKVLLIPSAMSNLVKPYDPPRIVSLLDSTGALMYNAKRRDKKISARLNGVTNSVYAIDMEKLKKWMDEAAEDDNE